MQEIFQTVSDVKMNIFQMKIFATLRIQSFMLIMRLQFVLKSKVLIVVVPMSVSRITTWFWCKIALQIGQSDHALDHRCQLGTK